MFICLLILATRYLSFKIKIKNVSLSHYYEP